MDRLVRVGAVIAVLITNVFGVTYPAISTSGARLGAWTSDLDAAVLASKSTGRPVILCTVHHCDHGCTSILTALPSTLSQNCYLVCANNDYGRPGYRSDFSDLMARFGSSSTYGQAAILYGGRRAGEIARKFGSTHSAIQSIITQMQSAYSEIVAGGSANKSYSSQEYATVLTGANQLYFTTSSRTPWQVSGESATLNSTGHYSVGQSLRSGLIEDGGSSYLQTTITGPAMVSFKWMVSSEERYDILSFSIDGRNVASRSGVNAFEAETWRTECFQIGSGSHQLKWTYSKDNSLGDGLDGGWIADLQVATDTVVVTFDANGGMCTVPSMVVGQGSTYRQLPTSVRNLHTFDGWYTSPEGGRRVYPSSALTSTGNHTLYAHWSVDMVRLEDDDIDYGEDIEDEWGGTFSRWPIFLYANDDSQTVFLSHGYYSWDSGETDMTLPAPPFSRTGYTFTGWEVSDACSPSSRGFYAQGEALEFCGGTTWLNACWKINSQSQVALDTALAGSPLKYSTSGSFGWYGQRDVMRDSNGAAQSGFMGDNRESVFSTTVTGAGTIGFWWKVSSEFDYDKLYFKVDGRDVVSPISGEVDWSYVAYKVGAGTHTLQWIYKKDESYGEGEDCGWVDQVVWKPNTPSAAWQKSRRMTGTASQAIGWCGGYVGTSEVKCGKIDRKGYAKISAKIRYLGGGTKSYSAQKVRVSSDEVVVRWPDGFQLEVSGTEYGGGYQAPGGVYICSRAIGGRLAGSSHGFSVEKIFLDSPAAGGGLHLLPYLIPHVPTDESWDGEMWVAKSRERVQVNAGTGRWSCGPAARVKLVKGVQTQTRLLGEKTCCASPSLPGIYYSLANVPCDGEGGWEKTWQGPSNFCALKLNYVPAKGLFKGTFTVYATNSSSDLLCWTPGAKPIFKKFKVKVNGLVVDGYGYGRGTCKALNAEFDCSVSDGSHLRW